MSMKDSLDGASAARHSRLAVLFPGALGDFICCLPALQVLARDAVLDVFGRSEFAAIAPDGIIVQSSERAEISRLFALDGATDQAVQGFFAGYETVYSWTGFGHENFVASLMTATRQRARIFPFRPAKGAHHQAEYYFRCIHGSGKEMPLPAVSIGADAMAWQKEYWRKHDLNRAPVLAIAPGSGSVAKNWPENHFCAVADWWRGRVGGQVVVLLGPVEEERGGFAALSSCALIARDLNLSQAAALLAAGSLYLGNDSGITHLAAATGTPTVAVFGPSDPRQWAPRGNRVTIVNRHEECLTMDVVPAAVAPHRCLSELDPEAVISVLGRVCDALP